MSHLPSGVYKGGGYKERAMTLVWIALGAQDRGLLEDCKMS